MPYNTRRKSLSLPALGIDLPKSARSPPVSTTDQPPAKKVKRSHTLSSTASSVATDVPHTRNARSPRSPHARNPLPRSRGGHVAEQTPPPSPVEPGSRKVDTQGIDDDIVVAVIEQLERTGNRPHHVKDLAAILSTFLTVVEGSANPQAIISSRLTSYLRRPWTALSPCPLGKELVGTHPKRTYFFLTTTPHPEIADPQETLGVKHRVITPSLTSEEDARDAAHLVRARSDSPELDLSMPEYDQPDGEDRESPSDSSFSGRSSLNPDGRHPQGRSLVHNRRAQSPPLERDEREFTQTASSIQQRSQSQELERQTVAEAASSVEGPDKDLGGRQQQETSGLTDDVSRRDCAAALFGHLDPSSSLMFDLTTSPMIKPQQHAINPSVLVSALGSQNSVKTGSIYSQYLDDFDVKMTGGEDDGWGWNDLKSPEKVELDELDDLLGGY